jgi:hypothetical protein
VRDIVLAPGRYHAAAALAIQCGWRSAGADQHIDEAAGAVLAQGLARLQASLADGGGQLVAGAGADGQDRAQDLGIAAAVIVGILVERGQQGGREIERIQPVQRIGMVGQYIGIAGGGIGGAGGQQAAAAELPQQPGIDAAKAQLSTFPGPGYGRVAAQQARGPQVGRAAADRPAQAVPQARVPVWCQRRQVGSVAAVLPGQRRGQRAAAGGIPSTALARWLHSPMARMRRPFWRAWCRAARQTVKVCCQISAAFCSTTRCAASGWAAGADADR